MQTNHHDHAYQLEKSFGFRLPAIMHDEFNHLVEIDARQQGHALTTDELNDLFCREYIENSCPFEITSINFEKEFVNTDQERLRCHATIKKGGHTQEVEGIGNGTLNALANAFKVHFGIELEVTDYLQHGLTQGSHALAASYIQANTRDGKNYWGVGIDTDSTLSAIRALLSAINREERLCK
jgi:2-isopropylmalate synthase